jgi:hypothetical protein
VATAVKNVKAIRAISCVANAGFILPFRLVLAKRYADDYSDVDETNDGEPYRFADKNLVVISALSTSGNSEGRSSGGNTVRIICGTTIDGVDLNTTDEYAGSKGFCEDLEEGKVYTLAGQAGRSGVGASVTGSPRSVAFGNLTGGTYDRFKNLIFTSAHDTTLFGNSDDRLNQDGDEYTDDVDPDVDGNGWDGRKDPSKFNLSTVDTDGDGLFDDVDTDDDSATNSGITDLLDPDQDDNNEKDWTLDPTIYNSPSQDTDGDGDTDDIDDDDDGDGDKDWDDMAQNTPSASAGVNDFDPDDNGNTLTDSTEGSSIYNSTTGLVGDDPEFPALYDNSIYSLQLVRRTGDFHVRYNFTDSNNFTSRYCLQMRMQTTCGYALQSTSSTSQRLFCACNITSPSGGSASASDFWMGVSSDDDCD